MLTPISCFLSTRTLIKADHARNYRLSHSYNTKQNNIIYCCMTEWLSVVGYPAEQRHSSGRNPHRIARIRSAQGKPWHWWFYPGISVTIRLRLSADGVGSLVDIRGSPDDRKESLRFRHRSRCSLDDGTCIDSIDELSLSLHPVLRTVWVKKIPPAVFDIFPKRLGIFNQLFTHQ